LGLLAARLAFAAGLGLEAALGFLEVGLALAFLEAGLAFLEAGLALEAGFDGDEDWGATLRARLARDVFSMPGLVLPADRCESMGSLSFRRRPR
jgi:hypothetical protein